MSALMPALKNEHTKPILSLTGIRLPAARPGTTAHYRMTAPETAGRHRVLGRYGRVQLLRMQLPESNVAANP